jgi:hypothetical protein
MANAAGPGPKFIVTDLRAICHKLDKDMEKPEIVYEWSNARKFESSDRSDSGVYTRG